MHEFTFIGSFKPLDSYVSHPYTLTLHYWQVTAWKESTLERLREELRTKENEAAAATSELKRTRTQLSQRVQLLLHERDQAMQVHVPFVPLSSLACLLFSCLRC
jgi:hypothetical protein